MDVCSIHCKYSNLMYFLNVAWYLSYVVSDNVGHNNQSTQ